MTGNEGNSTPFVKFVITIRFTYNLIFNISIILPILAGFADYVEDKIKIAIPLTLFEEL